MTKRFTNKIHKGITCTLLSTLVATTAFNGLTVKAASNENSYVAKYANALDTASSIYLDNSNVLDIQLIDNNTTMGTTSNVTTTYKVTNDWAVGYQAELIITNSTSSTINGWKMTFTCSNKINSLWGAEFVSQSGSTVTLKNNSWDTKLAPNAKVSIGFVADGSSSIKPTNIKFNGAAVNGGGNNQGGSTTPSTGNIIRPDKVSIVKTTPTKATSLQSSVSYGTIKKETYYSSITKTNRPYNIILPSGYTTSKKYPVIYLLHGLGTNQDGFGTSTYTSSTIRMIGNMIASKECKECIVVIPYIRVSTTKETNAYSVTNFKYYDNFKSELIYNLMPHINKKYSTMTGRANTAIAGFSMGGRESLNIGISKPDLFGYIGAFCPAPGCLPYTMGNLNEPGLFTQKNFTVSTNYRNNILIMIVKGQNDTTVAEHPKLYSNALKSNGTSHVYYEIPGSHEEKVYLNGLYNFLKCAFK